MYTVPLNIEQKEIMEEVLSRELYRKQKHFRKKRLSHFNNEKLKAVYEKYKVEYSPVLYTIPFKCFFSFYLYLIFKSCVKFMDWTEMPYYYRIALSQDFNINRLHYETGFTRTSIRKAFKELVAYRMIEITDFCKPEHAATKSILVYNDFYITFFDPEVGHVLFSSELPFNFYNKPLNKSVN